MTVYTNKSYKNESNNYQVVCNTSVVVFEGSQGEAQKYLDNTVLTVAYADATVVAPGETITGSYVANEQYPNRPEPEVGKEAYLSAFFDSADLNS